MKIAVLLFGHLRTYTECAAFLKENVLNHHECDIFIHTWDDIDSSTVCWNNRVRKNQNLTPEIIQSIKNLYNPKDIKIEHQNFTTDETINSLIDDKKVSLVTRPDIAIYKKLPLENSIKEAKTLGLDIEKCRFFCGLSNQSEKVNVSLMIHRGCDMLFWGKENAINNFINSNMNLDIDFAREHFYNVVSIYVANELKYGNTPQLVSFAFGKDWRNVRNSQNKKNKSMLYKFFHLYWLRGKK